MTSIVTQELPADAAPKHSLQDLAREHIREGLETAAEHDDHRIIWWDDGGFLRDVIEEACENHDELNLVAVGQDQNPLLLRRETFEKRSSDGEADYQLWYVPRARSGKTWFRDVEEGGARIEVDIEELSAEVYGVQKWRIFDEHRDSHDRGQRAKYLRRELTRSTGRPPRGDLQAELLTHGHGRPEEYILKNGWGDIATDGDNVANVKEELENAGIGGLEEVDQPADIERRVRKWAVAKWMLKQGFPSHAMSAPYDTPPNLAQGHTFAVLQDVLRKSKKEYRLDERYLEETYFFEDEIRGFNDPWALVQCPVNGALDEALWRRWLQDFDEGRLDECGRRALERRDVLCDAYDIDPNAIEVDDSPWVRAWEEAAQLADLAERLDSWTDRSNAPVANLYGDREEGTWKIDRAVRRIVVSGHPEESLPDSHPAREALGEIRQKLTAEDYIGYLDQLAEHTVEQFEAGKLFEELPRAHAFLSSSTADGGHWEKFQTNERVAVFYIDALRLDLAWELADRLEAISECDDENDYTVDSHPVGGMLPSETRFGMGALTPGRPDTFRVRFGERSNGFELWPERKGNDVSSTSREDLLTDEGWRIAKSRDEGWEEERHIAYFDKEIDDIGEDELSDFEALLAGRVEDLANFIDEVLSRGTWTKAFVVADHGFVLMPELLSQFETGSPDTEQVEIERRRVASRSHQQVFEGTSIVADSSDRGFEYLDDDVTLELAVKPLQRFSKQGISDARFYHGGALPQEFILNFLEITKQ